MTTIDLTADAKPAPTAASPGLNPNPKRPTRNTIAAGIVSWAVISAGFFGLGLLMQERPEFIGQTTGGPKAELAQESPSVVMRRMSDDVSVIKPMQPERAEVSFDIAGRRDYRGLRTIMDMSGGFQAAYGLSNSLDEPVFVLFKCPHPANKNQNAGGLPASGLQLESSAAGAQENTEDSWLWSGALPAHGGVKIEISYQVASLKSATYHVGEQNGNPVKQLRVTFHRRNLDSMRFESGDGPKASSDETVSWEQHDFLAPGFYSGAIVESRGLYQSLSQLLEIGPGVCLLFLLAVGAVILARQELNGIQVITIATGYALYFPLMLYLSARLSFPAAVVIAAIVPGTLLLNYARWLLGAKKGLAGGLMFLALYWIFPTLAVFAGWNRGMVLLCLGVVTLYVLIDLQNQTMRRKAVIAALLALCAWPGVAGAHEVQIVMPGEVIAKTAEAKPVSPPAIVAFAPAQYQARQETNYFHVEATVSFQILRAGDSAAALFTAPIYLQESHVESIETNLAWVISASNGLWLAAERAGAGTLHLTYRVPIENREGKRRAEIPVLAGMPGNLMMTGARNDFEILSGSLWGKNTTEKETMYDIGVTGDGRLAVEWREHGPAVASLPPATNGLAIPASVQTPKPAEATGDFYGIGLTRAQHLTVINSDGSCTHFAEFEMPAFQSGEFRVKLPAQARLISVSVNGNELQSPLVEDQICRVKLPGREAQQTVNRLSFRIAYPPLRLGFIGTADLSLPEVFQTTGATEWVVALPNGFETQVVSSGLERQKTPPDLSRFGDYGRILQSHAHTYLAKDLAPPGLVGLSLKYRQIVPGFSEPRAESLR